MSCVKQLQNTIALFNVIVELKTSYIDQLREIELHIGKDSWRLLIDDEYGYLNDKHQPICFFMTLRELKIYEQEEDFLAWCNQNGSNASSVELLHYYRELASSYTEIRKRLGTINPLISEFDFELRAGEFDDLLQAK